MISRTRSGFSLRELLVAMAVISIMMALCTRYVVTAREYNRREVCLSNMLQPGLAIQNYESRSSGSAYPGYKLFLRMDDGSSFKAPSITQSPYPPSMQGQDVAVSWLVEMFPYLDSSRLYHDWKTSSGSNRALPDVHPEWGRRVMFPYIDMIVCPSDPAKRTDTAPISIVVNAGMRDGSTPGARDFRENGVFHDHFADNPFQANATNLKTPLTLVNSAFIDRRGDGLQYTLMLSENVDAGSYLDTDERFLGFTWSKPSDPVDFNVKPPAVNPRKNVRRINEGIGRQKSVIEDPAETNRGVTVDATGNYAGLEDSDDDVFYYARPSSYHPGGVNVVFCDGHGQFLSDKIDYYVYIMLMTPFGQGVKDPHSHGELITDPGFANPKSPPPEFNFSWLTH